MAITQSTVTMDEPITQTMAAYQDVPGPRIDFNVTFPNLEIELKGANVLITGGASGIGKACATSFLQHGSYVTIADLSGPMLSSTTTELKALAGDRFQAVECNVTDWSAQLKLFQCAAELGPKGIIDVVIPCAGPRGAQFSFDAPDLAPKPDGSPTDIPAPPVGCVQVALIGMMYTCQLAVWYMARKEESLRCLIVIGSMTAYRGIAGNVDYSAAKYGARGLFKTLRDANANREYAPSGPALRVNYLCPGFVRTPFIERAVPDLLKAGLRFAPLETLVKGVMRIAADKSIHGKAVGVSPDECFDIGDDVPGANGVKAIDGQVWFERQAKIDRPRIGIW